MGPLPGNRTRAGLPRVHNPWSCAGVMPCTAASRFGATDNLMVHSGRCPALEAAHSGCLPTLSPAVIWTMMNNAPTMRRPPSSFRPPSQAEAGAERRRSTVDHSRIRQRPPSWPRFASFGSPLAGCTSSRLHLEWLRVPTGAARFPQDRSRNGRGHGQISSRRTFRQSSNYR